MKIREKFYTELCEASSEYDIVAICYAEILRFVEDTEINFVTQYIDRLDDDLKYNHYYFMFESFRKFAINIAKDQLLQLGGFDPKKFCELLFPRMKSIIDSLEADFEKGFPICLFYIISALDYIIGEEQKEFEMYSFWNQSCGPLNSGASLEKSVVYLQNNNNFLSPSLETQYFRKPLYQNRIGNQFSDVLLFRRSYIKERFSAIPKIKRIRCNPLYREQIETRKYFRIASVPFIGYPTIAFHNLKDPQPCAEGDTPEGSFYVEYPEKMEEKNLTNILLLLELAIEKEANIIVFPEYVVSERVLKGMKEYLSGLDRNRRKQLNLVFAGTMYKREEHDKGDNILTILNAFGSEVGRYYKYSPFLIRNTKGSEKAVPKSDGKTNKRKYIICSEILSNPGKECTLIDVDTIGRILPAICRDVIDGVYTKNLVEMFLPSLLIISAWSKSISRFESELCHFADTVLTSSLLCDCCNAVKREDITKPIGLYCLPEKVDNKMDSKPHKIIRDVNCWKNCEQKCGCVFLIDVDFSAEIIKSVESKPFHPKL